MRHRVHKKKLSRDPEHRKALAKFLATSLIEKDSIETTLAKAKYIKPYVEKLVTRVKNTKQDDKIKKFNLIKYLRNKVTTREAIDKLTNELGTRFDSRKGGYTRIIRTGNRPGDNTMKARIEFIDTKVSKTVESAQKEKEALKSKIKGKKTDKTLRPVPTKQVIKAKETVVGDRSHMKSSGER